MTSTSREKVFTFLWFLWIVVSFLILYDLSGWLGVLRGVLAFLIGVVLGFVLFYVRWHRD